MLPARRIPFALVLVAVVACGAESAEDVATSAEEALVDADFAGEWRLDASSVVARPERPVFETLRLSEATSWGTYIFSGKLRGGIEVEGTLTRSSTDPDTVVVSWQEGNLGHWIDLRLRGSGAGRVLRSEIYGTPQYAMKPVASAPFALPPGLDPFDDASCAGAALTDDEARAYLTPGTPSAVVGRFTTYKRTRTCTGTSCGRWTVKPSSDFDGGGTVEVTTKAGYSGAPPVVELLAVPARYSFPRGTPCGRLASPRCADYDAKITAKCFRAKKRTTRPSEVDATKTVETDWVAFGALAKPGAVKPVEPAEPAAFDPASCPTNESEFDLRGKLLSASGHRIELGAYKVLTRTRHCNQVSGCSAWTYGPDDDVLAEGKAALVLRVLGPNWDYPEVTLTSKRYPANVGTCSVTTAFPSCNVTAVLPPAAYDDVKLGPACFRAASHSEFMDGQGTTEIAERALLVRF